MTLTSTIRRREKRQRAKARRARWAAGPRISLCSGDWLVREQLDAVVSNLTTMARLVNREYKG